MRKDRASELGLSSITDLVARAGELNLGIEDDFQRRPLDGLTPLLARYGMAFRSVDTVKLDNRANLYDKLLDGDVDVAEIYTTDGQLAEYDLMVLQDDLTFFPVYEAAPLARADALAKHKNLGAALSALDGKIDAATMQSLNGRVEIEGRSAASVARSALAELGLIEGGAVTTDEPLVVSTTSSVGVSDLATTALRAVRRAFTGREVNVEADGDPLAQVASGDARMALVGADAFFDLSGAVPSRDDRFEAVAVVGQNVVHLIAKSELAGAGSPDLKAITSLATGPDGSPSARLAAIVVQGLGLEAALKYATTSTPDAVIETMTSGGADAALVVAPLGDRSVFNKVDGETYGVLPLGAWKEGANLVRYPFLREVRIPANTYKQQAQPIDALGVQVVLSGMAPATGDAVGDQGPSAVSTTIAPIPAATIKTITAAIPGTLLVDPTLRQAAALSPELPSPPAAINPAADVSILNILIFLMFVGLLWLYARPEHS
jgi:TRAP-type uncharacterized transport system substrate-binding protein